MNTLLTSVASMAGFIAVATSVGGVLYAALGLFWKLKAVRHLRERLAQNSEFVEMAKRYNEAVEAHGKAQKRLAESQMERLKALIELELARVSTQEKLLVRQGLHQPSDDGKARYVDSLARRAVREAEVLLH